MDSVNKFINDQMEKFGREPSYAEVIDFATTELSEKLDESIKNTDDAIEIINALRAEIKSLKDAQNA